MNKSQTVYHIITYQSRDSEHHAGDASRLDEVNHVVGVHMTLRLRNHKLCTQSQRRHQLKNVSVEADGVAEHHNIVRTCRQGVDAVKWKPEQTEETSAEKALPNSPRP